FGAIETAITLQKRQNLPSPSLIFATIPKVRQAPSALISTTGPMESPYSVNNRLFRRLIRSNSYLSVDKLIIENQCFVLGQESLYS
ncbi:hypothetical protein, partial [Halothiobacillus sp.]|uniref:hypothetical protein n=1 Tax=Halothiobacillus sp. TaxID=1891311 RepID=UPI003D0A072E